jgi:RNA polymerase sigma factor (sigma-70 family)
MSSESHSVTLLLTQLKAGDRTAAEEIWKRFFGRVVSLARHRLGTGPRQVADEEDIAASAMGAMYAGISDGRFRQLSDRDDLWQILCMLTSRKAANHFRRYSRQQQVGESAITAAGSADTNAPGLEFIAAASPTAAYLDSLAIECEELLALLDDRLREVAILRLHGYTNQEIAEQLGRSVKSVERYLKLIRVEWMDV